MSSAGVRSASHGPRVILVGPMGAGKSSAGAELAALWDTRFLDSDRVIEDFSAATVPELFAQRGEETFRQIEERTIVHLVHCVPGVLALGGGAVLSEATRGLLASHTVVYLQVDAEHVKERLAGGAGRPLLAGNDPYERWEMTARERAALYAEVATFTVNTNGKTPRQVAEEIAARCTEADGVGHGEAPAVPLPPGVSDAIQVGEGESAYTVSVGRNLTDVTVAAIPESVARVMIVHQGAVRERAEVLQGRCKARGLEAFLAEIPDGEEAKSAQVLAFLWQVLGQATLTRSDLIIGLGGGAATDLAGFAAASWLRGISVIHCPTTVAGMVDAAVGGKTGINTAEGKNLVGAFHPPHAVIADLECLASLPSFDVAAGLAEVVKAGFIADPRILEIIEADPARVLDVSSPEFAEVLSRAIRVKAEVVSDDLTEKGRREILNYGHTLGHAIERHERYRWRHGAAVSVGMVFAAELAFLAGYIDESLVRRHREVLSSLGLPVSYAGGNWKKLHEAMLRDKKARGALLRFVVLTGVGATTRLEGPDPALLTAAYAAVSEEPA